MGNKSTRKRINVEAVIDARVAAVETTAPDQSVDSGDSPVFDAGNFTGIGPGGIDPDAIDVTFGGGVDPDIQDDDVLTIIAWD